MKWRRQKGSDAAFLPEGRNLFCRIDMHLSDSPWYLQIVIQVADFSYSLLFFLFILFFVIRASKIQPLRFLLWIWDCNRHHQAWILQNHWSLIYYCAIFSVTAFKSCSAEYITVLDKLLQIYNLTRSLYRQNFIIYIYISIWSIQ